jgi:hypothetical protein
MLCVLYYRHSLTLNDLRHILPAYSVYTTRIIYVVVGGVVIATTILRMRELVFLKQNKSALKSQQGHIR